MGALVSAVIVVMLVVVWQIPPLFKKRQYKEMAAYLVITIAAVYLFAMQTLRIPVPNPLGWITAVYKAMGLIVGN